MNLKIHNFNEISVAELIPDDFIINEVQDMLDLIANASYSGVRKIIIHESNITPDFFDLKTGIAGEMLQKFSTYRMQLAIIGDFSKYKSKSFRDFIYESNKYGRILFLPAVEMAFERFTQIN